MSRTALALITQTCRRLDVLLPPALAKDLKAAEAICDRLPDRDTSTRAPIAEALALYAKGTDAAADPEIQRRCVAYVLEQAGMYQQAQARVEGDIGDALEAHADALLSAWSKGVAEDLAAITAAAGGGVPSLGSETNGIADKSLPLWYGARQAVATLASADQGVGVLLMLCHRPAPDKLTLWSPDVSDAARVHFANDPTHPCWSLASTGCELGLITSLAELDARREVMAGAL